jgi:hypothetical protein
LLRPFFVECDGFQSFAEHAPTDVAMRQSVITSRRKPAPYGSAQNLAAGETTIAAIIDGLKQRNAVLASRAAQPGEAKCLWEWHY